MKLVVNLMLANAMVSFTEAAALEAFDAGIALPSTNAVKELFGQATRNGMGDLDFSALFDLLNDRPGNVER